MTDDENERYNGWKNFQTWNVALWLQNDEGLYSLAKRAMRYEYLIAILREQFDRTETPDGVAWNDSSLDIDELDALLEEL